MSATVMGFPDSPAPTVEAVVALAVLSDSQRALVLDLVNWADGIHHEVDAPDAILDLIRSTPEVGDAALKIGRLDSVARQRIRQLHTNSKKAQLPWVIDEAFNSQQCLLAQSYQMTLDGQNALRVNQVAEFLERLGRKVTNPTWVIRNFKINDKPIFEVLDEGAGRRSMVYRLTEAGMLEGKSLHDLATTVGKTGGKTRQ